MWARVIAAAAITASLTMACDRTSTAGTDAPKAPTPVAETGKPRPAHTKVYTADAVTVQVLEKSPRKLVIKVRGSVRTGGWANAELRPLQTLVAEKGLMSFIFVAQGPAPDMFVTQMITPIEATLTLEGVTDDVTQVKVMAETNEISQPLP